MAALTDAGTADLVRRFAGMGALSGYALLVGEELAGYVYFVTERSKALIGDLYVRRSLRCQQYEDRLLDAALVAMFKTPLVQRVEAQLLLLPSSLDREVPRSRYLHRYRREFMMISADAIRKLPGSAGLRGFRIEPWSPRAQEGAARVIADAYAGHIDSQINDQYRSVSGARRFLLNIVQYPGCGTFFQPGSFVAMPRGSSEPQGLCLASLVASDVGHITQICVVRSVRGRGAGAELLRRSLAALLQYGCRKVGLTVTSSNKPAIRLYERLGFRTVRSFAAYVWEGF